MKLSLSLVLLMLAPQFALAQGSEHGNGGDPNEVAEIVTNAGEQLPSWYTVKMDLIAGFEANQHLALDLKGRNADEFKAAALNALRNATVAFNDEKNIVEGVEKPCKNWVEGENQIRIRCNFNLFVATMKNYTVEEMYKFEAHEYLAGANLEPNDYKSSSFLFSEQISANLHVFTSKRWAVASKLAVQTGELKEIARCRTERSTGNWGTMLYTNNKLDRERRDIIIQQIGEDRSGVKVIPVMTPENADWTPRFLSKSGFFHTDSVVGGGPQMTYLLESREGHRALLRMKTTHYGQLPRSKKFSVELQVYLPSGEFGQATFKCFRTKN